MPVFRFPGSFAPPPATRLTPETELATKTCQSDVDSGWIVAKTKVLKTNNPDVYDLCSEPSAQHLVKAKGEELQLQYSSVV